MTVMYHRLTGELHKTAATLIKVVQHNTVITTRTYTCKHDLHVNIYLKLLCTYVCMPT